MITKLHELSVKASQSQTSRHDLTCIKIAAGKTAARSRQQARRLVKRFSGRYTPKRGRWLDRAGSELSVLSRPCLDRRIPDKEGLIKQVAAWRKDRDKNAKADWPSTTADARVKLKGLHLTS